MKISQDTSVSMPVKNMIGIVVAVAMGVFAYTEVLKKSEQLPTDQEQFMLVEDLYKTTEKLEIRIDNMMHNKINIEFLKKQTEKLLEDVEKLKDKVRQNGNGHG
jgi:L-cysteine desulfidase